MQYYPPCVTPNGGQTYPYNPFPVTQPCPCPVVVGEGSVASVALPDGSVQLYFVPRATPGPAPPAPPACCPCPCPPHGYPTWNNPEAWFIRSVPNQFPAYQPVPNQQFQRQATPPWPQSSNDYNGNKPAYELKFHNDSCTSTTDLHYFSPPLRNWFPKQCASTQTEEWRAPVEPPPWPDKPCACACYKHNENRKGHDALSDNKSSCSSMSVEVGKEEKPITSSRVKKKKYWARPSRKIQISEKPIQCEYDLQAETHQSNKAVTTYAEKMVGGCADNGRETQTPCEPSTSIRRVDSFFRVSNCETEMWYPKSPLSRKSMECSDCTSPDASDAGEPTSGAGASASASDADDRD